MAVLIQTAPMTDESSGSGSDLVLGTAHPVLTFLRKKNTIAKRLLLILPKPRQDREAPYAALTLLCFRNFRKSL